MGSLHQQLPVIRSYHSSPADVSTKGAGTEDPQSPLHCNILYVWCQKLQTREFLWVRGESNRNAMVREQCHGKEGDREDVPQWGGEREKCQGEREDHAILFFITQRMAVTVHYAAPPYANGALAREWGGCIWLWYQPLAESQSQLSLRQWWRILPGLSGSFSNLARLRFGRR